AIVLRQRDKKSATLRRLVGGAALEALEIVQSAVEIGSHLLDLAAERTALRWLAAEQGEEAAALAADPLVLRNGSIEFGLLSPRGVFVAPDLLRACRIRAAAIDRRELALKPHAHRSLAAGRRIALCLRARRRNCGEQQRECEVGDL